MELGGFGILDIIYIRKPDNYFPLGVTERN
jgi:hypothetical protein